MPHRLLCLALFLGLTGCAPPFTRKEGETCYRTTECSSGLVCAMGRCSSDPTGLGGGVPTLDAGPDAALDASVDAGPDAAQLDGGMDAATPDAAMDAATPDAAMDAATPDASMDSGMDPDASDDASMTDV